MTARLYNIYSMDEEVRIRAALENSLVGGGGVGSFSRGAVCSFQTTSSYFFYFLVSDYGHLGSNSMPFSTYLAN